MPTFHDVLDAARTLTPTDRMRLVDALWEDVPPTEWPLPSAEWIAEAQRRSADYDQGRTSAAPHGRRCAPALDRRRAWMGDVPRLSPWFWVLLESSGRSLRSLCRRLEQLPKEQLRRYRLEYDEAKDCVNPCYWQECQPYFSNECSEDHGDDFSAWVVMQGREFFNQVLSHPEGIQRYLDMFGAVEMRQGYPELRWDEEVDRDEYRGCQRADYIASPIYKTRFGEDLDDASYDQ